MNVAYEYRVQLVQQVCKVMSRVQYVIMNYLCGFLRESDSKLKISYTSVLVTLRRSSRGCSYCLCTIASF